MKTNLSDTKSKKELSNLLDTDIFWIGYTHVTTNASRTGVEKTKRIVCPSIALASGIPIFSGEFAWFDGFTFLFRHYHVSVSNYPTTEHSWRAYVGNKPFVWTRKESERYIGFLEEKIGEIKNRKFSLADFEKPEFRRENVIQLQECIDYEHFRQQEYEKLTDEQRKSLYEQKYDMYVFNDGLRKLTKRLTFNGGRVEHPFVVGDINLMKYLRGMFTQSDVALTKEWIGNVLSRNIPVGSLESLKLWEDTYTELPSYKECVNDHNFYFRIMGEKQFREKIRVKAKLKIGVSQCNA